MLPIFLALLPAGIQTFQEFPPIPHGDDAGFFFRGKLPSRPIQQSIGPSREFQSTKNCDPIRQNTNPIFPRDQVQQPQTNRVQFSAQRQSDSRGESQWKGKRGNRENGGELEKRELETEEKDGNRGGRRNSRQRGELILEGKLLGEVEFPPKQKETPREKRGKQRGNDRL